MKTVVGKPRISFEGHRLWRATIEHSVNAAEGIMFYGIGHCPASAYSGLKARMERAGYELVAPQHATESKGGVFGTSPSMAQRSILQLEANRRAHALLTSMPSLSDTLRQTTPISSRYERVLAPVDADPVIAQYDDHALPLDEVRLRDPQRVVPGYYALRGHP